MGTQRITRGGLSALVTTLVALTFHAGAGGHSSTLAAVVTFIFSFWLATLLAGRTWGVCSLVVIAGCAQLGLHWVTVTLAGASTPIVADASVAGTHAHHQTGAIQLAATPHSGAHGLVHEVGFAMLAAHIAAALITAYFIKRGEELLLNLGETVLGHVALTLLAFTRPELPEVRATVAFAPLPAYTNECHRYVHSRGPPVLTARHYALAA